MINQVILEGRIGTGLQLHHDTSTGDNYTCKITVESDDLTRTDSVILTFPLELIKKDIAKFQIGKMVGVKARLHLTPIGRLQVLVEQVIFIRNEV